VDRALSRRTLLKASAAGLVLASMLPGDLRSPAEVLAELEKPLKRFVPLDRSMLRNGRYDLFISPHDDPSTPSLWAEWYEGQTRVAAGRLAVDVVIADGPEDALSPLYALTTDFVGPQAQLARAFYSYGTCRGRSFRPLLAKEREILRLAKEAGLPAPEWHPAPFGA